MSSPYIFETMPPDSSEVKRVSVAPTLANIFGSPPNVTKSSEAPTLANIFGSPPNINVSKSSEAPLLGPVPIPYIKLRTQLFQDAFFQSVNGAPFNDTQIYVFSARARSGVVHKPRVVHTRSAFLETASAQFKNKIYKSCSVNTRGAVTRRRERSEDGYDDDSDLEDMEEEPEVSSSLHDTSAARSEEGRCVDDTKRASAHAPEASVGVSGEKPPVSVVDILPLPGMKTEQTQEDTRPPTEKPSTASEAGTAHSKEEADVKAGTIESDRILVIPDSAFKTWQVLLMYLYNDYLNFAPLQSENQPAQPESGSRPQCSPKSMYRLADKLGLVDLKQSALMAMRKSLSKGNIITELFSDFTWRYPEVLQMETEVFNTYSSQGVVQAALSETFQGIAAGLYPHSAVVLDSLFKKLERRPREEYCNDKGKSVTGTEKKSKK